MKKVSAILILLMLWSASLSAAINTVSGVTLSPAGPNPGESTTVSWTYTNDYAEPANYFMAIYNACTIPNTGAGNSTSMKVLVGDACAAPTPATNCLSCVSGGGCNELGSPAAGTHNTSKTITMPSTLIPGYSYYLVVAMKSYNVYMNPDLNDPVNLRQACVPFTVPLTDPYISLRKTAEGTTGSVGTEVLFSIYYDAGNVHNFRITDTVDSRFTILQVFNGGTAVGQNITWVVNSGYITSPVKGSVSFLAQINAGTTGTIIPNTAVGVADEIAGSNSNTANVVIGQPGLSITKSVSRTTANTGDTLTYIMQYLNQGTTLVEFENFESGTIPAGWVQNPAGGTWTAADFTLRQTATGVGYVGLMDTNITPLHDGIYVTDVLIPSSNTAHMDAVLHFIQVDNDNFYMARINASDNRLYLDKVVGGTSSIGGTSVPNPHGLDILQDTWYTLKVQVCGSSIMMKVWPRDQQEDSSWDLSVTDSSIPGNGIVGYQANEGPQQYDNLKVFSLTSSTNPRIFDTVPAGVNYLDCSGGTGCSKPGSVINWTVGSTCAGAQAVTWRGIVSASCGANVTNTAGIDSDDPPPPVFSNAVYTTLDCPPTNTPTVTNTTAATDTFTNTATRTNTPTFTHTFTQTASSTNTFTRTFTNTNTVTNTSTATFTNTSVPPTATFTPTQTMTLTYTATITRTFTNTASSTFTATNSATGTYTPTITDTFTPTATNTFSSTITNTVTRTFTPTITNTFTLTVTGTLPPTNTFTETYTATPTFTATLTYTATATRSFTASATDTFTATNTVSNTFTSTTTDTPTQTCTHSPSSTPTYTFTNTFTTTITGTFTETVTGTQPPTGTFTNTFTFTATGTSTFTFTVTYTSTGTVTYTPTFTQTDTGTPPPSATFTPTFTHTFTHTPSNTFTLTYTPTATVTFSPTYSFTSAYTVTSTATGTATFTNTFTATQTFTTTPSPTNTPSGGPVTLSVKLSAAGDEPVEGARVTYRLNIENKSSSTVTNISIWDTLPANVRYTGTSYSVAPAVAGNFISWDLTGLEQGTIAPGASVTIYFEVEITEIVKGDLISNTAWVDYNDPYYSGVFGKHPPVNSNTSFYPQDVIVIYPNPVSFAKAVGGALKFLNVIPGSLIQVYTVSGENVMSETAQYIVHTWDGKNRYNMDVSPGVYFYTVENAKTGMVTKGKLFVTGN